MTDQEPMLRGRHPRDLVVPLEPHQLALLGRAQQALAEARTVDDIRRIRDKAEAARHYAKAARLGLEIQNQAATIKLEAERKASSVLATTTNNNGQILRGRQMQPRDETPTLAELGVSKNQSHRWQLAASVPDAEFRNFVKAQNESSREITTSGLLKVAKQLAAQKTTRTAEPVAGVVGDIDELLKADTRFSCIYADPPWQYGNQATRAATDNHYPTMSIEQLCKMPIKELAAENAHLHLWTTSSFVREAMQLIEAWGFEYKSGFVWVKSGAIGIGNYWRITHEFLLLGVRGSLPFLDHSLRSWIEAPREEHSRKPEAVRKLIEKTSPSPRLELFARRPASGWAVFGNQIDKSP